MVQELIIRIDSNKPLNAYGEGHVIIYDARKGMYYVQTREEFLLPQNEQIQKLRNEITRLTTENIAFKKEINNRLDEFMKTYQETNNTLIEMVKEVVGGE